MLWPSQHELALGSHEPGWDHAIQLCHELNIPSITLWEAAQSALAQAAKPYRDDIHPNGEGQKLIAAALEQALMMAWPREDNRGR
jgi:lysophospholipase L1-like esterase